MCHPHKDKPAKKCVCRLLKKRKPMATSTYYRKHAASSMMATIVGAAILLSTVDAQTTSQPPVPTAGPVDPGIAAVQTLQQTLSQILSQIAELNSKFAGYQTTIKRLNESVTALQGGSVKGRSMTLDVTTTPVPAPPAIMPKGCADVKKLGGVQTGFHIVVVTVGNRQMLKVVWCDLAHTVISGGPIGYLNATSSGPVQFSSQRKTPFNGGSVTGSPMWIPYENNLINTGGAMNLNNGIFTAPVSGRYRFSFNAISSYWGSTIWMNVNGKQYVAAAYGVGVNKTNDNRYTMSVNVILNLTASSWVGMLVNAPNKEVGGVYDTANMHFTNLAGKLIDEDLSIAL